ncbi:MAG: hypothetical protein K5981_08335 [Clostridia bacterium]|nr:hypothetical protein [Clostridia bacterium]
MDNNTDQTKFWLAWHATCAAVDCTDASVLESKCRAQPDPKAYEDVLADISGTTELALGIIKSTNFKFRSALHYFDELYGKRRLSDYADEAAGWQDGVPGQGCAFTVLESQLYANGTLAGQPFKDYLFEDIGCRPGGLSANICGYLNKTLRTIVQRSFSKTYRIEEHENDEGNEREGPRGLSTETRTDFSSLSPRLRGDVNEVIEFFGKYVDELGSPDGDVPAAWDKDHWISIYCALHEIPINNPEVRALCRRSRSMLAEIYTQTRDKLLFALRKRLKASDRAIAWAMDGGAQSLLDEKMRNMPFYADLERIRKNRLKKSADEAENAR